MRKRNLPPNLSYPHPEAGVTIHKSGYLRYTSPSFLRDKYVHRVIVENNILASPLEIRSLLPWPYEVHHMDYNKLNNNPSNLLMLSLEFHSKLTADGRTRQGNGRFHPKWRKPPSWVKEEEKMTETTEEEGAW